MGKIVRTFRCDVITPEGVTESMEALGAVFPASDGLVGVLGGRAPLVAAVGVGPMTVQLTDGSERRFFIAGGFAQMLDDVLTVMAEDCIPVDKLVPEEIWDEIQHASSLPQDTEAQRIRHDEALHAARTKFRVAQEATGGTIDIDADD